MSPLAAEWVEKAEGDFFTMEREGRARKNKNYDSLCFHAQQCAEKYLKAVLCNAGIDFIRTHDLVALLEKALMIKPEWESFREDLAYLSDYAVNYRYPGDSADRDSALNARRRCRIFRMAVREYLIPNT